MSDSATQDVTIVGAGQAGLQTAQSLRKRGFEGTITIIGNEGHSPYQRPPLSKAFLKNEIAEARLSFKPDSFYDEQNIDRYLSSNVGSIDTESRRVFCSDGSSFAYDRLAIATGSTPIALPVQGSDLHGVLALRGLDDAKAIRQELDTASHIVVVGGGYIGLEVASAARQLNREVTVVERLPRLLSRVTSPEISKFYLSLHRERGVDVRLEDSVVELVGNGTVTGVRLATGEVLPAQLVVVGIGVRPNQQLAADAGIDCDDGILVDSVCRTSDPFVYAAGDCARQRRSGGNTLRLESVHNALVQAEQIAADICGNDPPAFDPPWFWSDQYEIKIQTVGLLNDYDDIAVIGDPAEKRFSALYFRNDQLIALDAVNHPVAFMCGKQLLKQGIAVKRDEISSPDTNMKELLTKHTT